MTWAKLDDKLHSHPKAIEAGLEAMGLWVLTLSYCADYLTDGFVSRNIAFRIGGEHTQQAACKLVEVGLWSEVENGWQIRDYLEYNPSSEEERRRKSANLDRQKKRRTKVTVPPVTPSVTRDNQRDSERTPSVTTSVTNTECHAEHNEVVTRESQKPDPDPDPIKRSSALQHARSALTEVPPPEPLGPEATEVLRMLRKQKIIEPVATPKLAETIASRILSNGTKLEWIERAISEAALEAESNAAVGSPLAPVALARMVAKFCGHARPPKDIPNQPSANSAIAAKPASKPRAHRPFPGTESDVPKAAAS